MYILVQAFDLGLKYQPENSCQTNILLFRIKYAEQNWELESIRTGV